MDFLQKNATAKRVPLSAIDFADRTFALVPADLDAAPAALRAAIGRAGILHPPILRAGAGGGFRIVSGRKRLEIARDDLGERALLCLALGTAVSDLDCLEIVLEDTTASRPPSPVERAVFFKKSLAHVSEKEAAARFLPRLGIEPHPFHVRRALRLLDLEEPLLKSLHRGDLEEAMARELIALPFADRLALWDIIRSLSLGTGKQRKLVQACKEIAARHHVTIYSLLTDEEAARILRHPEANVPQKATNLLAWLDRRRLPRLSAAEEKFKKLEKRLELPQGASLGHTLSFEDDFLTLTLAFRTRRELLAHWQAIEAKLELLPD